MIYHLTRTFFQAAPQKPAVKQSLFNLPPSSRGGFGGKATTIFKHSCHSSSGGSNPAWDINMVANAPAVYPWTVIWPYLSGCQRLYLEVCAHAYKVWYVHVQMLKITFPFELYFKRESPKNFPQTFCAKNFLLNFNHSVSLLAQGQACSSFSGCLQPTLCQRWIQEKNWILGKAIF